MNHFAPYSTRTSPQWHCFLDCSSWASSWCHNRLGRMRRFCTLRPGPVPWYTEHLQNSHALEDTRAWGYVGYPWTKTPPRGQRAMAFDAEALGDFFNLYFKMFAYEDLGAMMSSTSLTSVVRQITLPISGDLRYYTRLSLVTLLRHFKTTVITNWSRCKSSTYGLDPVLNVYFE